MPDWLIALLGLAAFYAVVFGAGYLAESQKRRDAVVKVSRHYAHRTEAPVTLAPPSHERSRRAQRNV